MLNPVTTSLQDVRTKLKKLISINTIIIGHSLDSDLRSLLLIHNRVIDTAVLYPHPKV